MVTSATAFGDLEILDEIGRGAHTNVYRVRRGEAILALKVLRDGVSSQSDDIARRFRREAVALARVHHAGLPAIMEVGEAVGRPYLLMEYVAGGTLARLLQAGPLPETRVIALAETLAGVLDQVHRHGLVHRDVKPANILLNEAGEARLVDFGFAVQASTALDAEAIAGTFLYSAPEQSGMLKRPVDGRADLYALGVVLFECLTGTLPFRAKDLGELMRQHVAVRPPDVRELNPALSPALAVIVAKLLAKDPDDRYQTGAGLLGDLQQLSVFEATLAAGQTLVLDAAAEAVQAREQAGLVGREREWAQMQSAWMAARDGRGAVLLIEGEAGSGKSRLARELLGPAYDAHAVVLAGRCGGDDGLPLAPWREACDNALRVWRAHGAGVHSEARARLRAAAGEQAGLLKALSPLMRAEFEDVPDVVEGGAARASLSEALAQCVFGLAREFPAVLIVLDDVQELDEASRQVLTRLVAGIAHARILLVATAQQDARYDEAIERFIGGVQGTPFQRISVGALDVDAVARLVTDYLGGAPLEPVAVHQLAARSNGNPLLVVQYLQAMLDAGLLRPAWGAWQVDLAGLERLALPRDVLQLVMRRAAGLSPATRAILETAAVLGVRFTPEHIAAIRACTLSEVDSALTEAGIAHLVERAAGDEYSFVHTQVREAVLANLDTEVRRGLHQRVAEWLDARGGEGADHWYALARYYSEGDAKHTPRRACEVNLEAGRLALASHALEDAYNFLRTAEAFAGFAAQPVEFMRGLYELLGDLCVRTGRVEDGVSYLERCVAAATEREARALLQARLAQAYLDNFDATQANVQIEQALSALQQAPLDTGLGGRIELARLRAQVWWAERVGAPGVQGAERERLRLIERVHQAALAVAYMGQRLALWEVLGLRSLVNALRLGNSRELVYAYANEALWTSRAGEVAPAERYSAAALRVAETLDERASRAHARLTQALVWQNLGRAREAEHALRACLQAEADWLEAWDYQRACNALGWALLMRGQWSEALEWIQRSRGVPPPGADLLSRPSMQVAPLLAALGQPSEGRRVLERLGAITAPAQDSLRRMLFLADCIFFQWESGELGTALHEALSAFHSMGYVPEQTPLAVRHVYVLQAYAQLARAVQAGATGLVGARAAVAELARVAAHPLLRGHYLIATAIVMRIEQNYAGALDQLTAAVRLAHDEDAPWVLYEAHVELARVYAVRGATAALEWHARAAERVAIEQKWPGRVVAVRQAFHLVEAEHSTVELQIEQIAGTATAGAGPGAGTPAFRLKRYLDALLQVSLASAGVLNPDLQARSALDAVVRILGAERAFMFIGEPEGEALTLRAGRDAVGRDLSELTGYSRTIVERVRAERLALVVGNAQEGAALGAESMIVQDMRSIVATPMLLRERLVGVVYLDNRLAQGVFTQDDVQILQAIGNQIAIAIETSRMVEMVHERTTALQQAYERLERLDRKKSDFINIASHELRTPLTLVQGYSQMLLRDPGVANNTYYQQLVAGINSGADRLHEILNNMLDMAKIESQSLQLFPEPIGMGWIVDAVAGGFGKVLAERTLTLSIEGLRALPPCEADPQALRKVFTELIGNAIKYTPDGGRIAITGRALGGEGDAESGVELVVSDTGIGIDAAVQELIFAKFYQTGEIALHSSGKTKYKGGGPGLGLSIARGLVEAHGGRIWVESPGHDETTCPGSRFHIVLPLRQAARAGG